MAAGVPGSGCAGLPHRRRTGPLNAARQALEDLRDLKTGRLRTGAFASANAHLMPTALAAFHATHPGVALTVSEANPATLLPNLQSGLIDIAVISVYPHQISTPTNTPCTISWTIH